MIYFIRDASGHIKIGYSETPWARLAQIQVGSPLPMEMLAVIDGGKDVEATLHGAFSANRIRGEWFVNDGPLALYTARLPAPERQSQQRKMAEGSNPLRAWRLGAGVTLTQLGAQLDLSHAQVSRIERMGTNLLDLAIRLAEITGTEPADFRLVAPYKPVAIAA